MAKKTNRPLCLASSLAVPPLSWPMPPAEATKQTHESEVPESAQERIAQGIKVVGGTGLEPVSWAAEFELLGTEKAGVVIGTTADTAMSVSLYGKLNRTEYMSFAAGSTSIMSTAAYIDRLVVIPVSTGAGAVTLSDGTTAIVSIPAAAHAVDPHPYAVPLGIRNTAAAGFKLVLGASVSAVAVGAFVGAKTSA